MTAEWRALVQGKCSTQGTFARSLVLIFIGAVSTRASAWKGVAAAQLAAGLAPPRPDQRISPWLLCDMPGLAASGQRGGRWQDHLSATLWCSCRRTLGAAQQASPTQKQGLQ